MKTTLRVVLYVLAALGVTLLVFDAWYFFVRRGVGPSFYWERHVTTRSERLSEEPLYDFECAEQERLTALYDGEPAIVFVGDSQTWRFHLAERFPGLPVVNRGIGSDTTAGLLARWDATIANLPAAQVLIQIGYNDHEYRSIDESLANTREIIARAQTMADRVLVQSLLPVRGRGAEAPRLVEQHNAGLESLAVEMGAEWLDLMPVFADENGAMRADLSDDGVHPNERGYDVWADLLRDRLEAPPESGQIAPGE